MASEAFALIWRRFERRLLESGLLVLAVALGVGAATAGLALFLHAEEMAARTLASVDNRVIVVSAQSSADDMDVPAVRRPEGSSTILTVKDLDARDLLPMVTQAYVSNETELRFINQSFLDRLNQAGTTAGGPGGPDLFGGLPPDEAGAANSAANNAVNGTAGEGAAGLAGTGPAAGLAGADSAGQGTAVPAGQPASAGQAAAVDGTGSVAAAASGEAAAAPAAAAPEADRRQAMQQQLLELQTMAGSGDVFMPELETLKGYEVSPGFFDAWGLSAAQGSLFSSADGDAAQGLIVLGSEAARNLAGSQLAPQDLLGKKLLAFGTYRTVVGLLAPSGVERHDQSFFIPARLYTGQEAGGFMRRRAMDTQLRFVVDDPANLGQAAALLGEWFGQRYGEGKTVVSNPRESALTIIARNRGISFLILFLAVSGLFIATVNVSNMLLSRGLRMTRSTGILMALGASKRSVLGLFAREALMVALMGGAVGCLIAFPLSRTMEAALGISSASLAGLLPGLLGSLGFVLIFSMIPAWQNSRVRPADAMRSA